MSTQRRLRSWYDRTNSVASRQVCADIIRLEAELDLRYSTELHDRIDFLVDTLHIINRLPVPKEA